MYLCRFSESPTSCYKPDQSANLLAHGVEDGDGVREMENEKRESEEERIILFGFRFLRYFADYLAEDQMTV